MAKIITIIYNQSDNIEQTPPNYELQQNNLIFNIDDKSKAFSINKPFEFDDNIKSKIYDIGSSILCLKKKDFLNINHMEKNTFSSDENSDKNINLNLKYTSMSKDIDLDLEPLYHSSKDCISFCFPEKSKREIKDTSQSSVLGSKAHDFITSCTTFNETKSYTENSSSYCTKKTNTSFKKFKNQTYIIGNISYMENHITYLLFYDIYKLLNYNLNFSVKLNNKFISNYQLINDINVSFIISLNDVTKILPNAFLLFSIQINLRKLSISCAVNLSEISLNIFNIILFLFLTLLISSILFNLPKNIYLLLLGLVLNHESINASSSSKSLVNSPPE